ncbi:MAG TPA: hypothetical protein VHX66_14245 [Solirubrobacteraceae bacterium]|jgi:hypothetical protein|nr:hypothetical protein [Solirubrobacteraceae bacterium]
MAPPLYIAPPERLRDRLAARLRAGALDTALANGAPSEAGSSLALRARRLTRAPSRRKLARSIEELIRDADHAEGRWHLHVGPLTERVSAATAELTVLAEKLAEPAPVCARGVAEAVLLLTDGTGPLYNARCQTSVRARAASAAAHLSLAA